MATSPMRHKSNRYCWTP